MKGGECMASVNNKADIIATMEEWFKKAPELPVNARETLVKIMPWIALIFGVLGVLGGLGAVGVSPVGLFGGIRNSAMVLVSGILTIVAGVMLLMAYSKVKALKIEGWRLLFWSTVVSLVSSLVVGAIISAIIWALIEFYLLFQIKSHYK